MLGNDNFVALISYKRLGMRTGESFVTTTHFIVFYSRNRALAKQRKLFELQEPGIGTGDHYNQVQDRSTGLVRPLRDAERGDRRLAHGEQAAFQLISLATGGYRPNTTVTYEFEGAPFFPGDNKCWRTGQRSTASRLALSRSPRPAGSP